MRSYLRAAVAAIVLGSGLIGQGMRPGTRPAHAALPVHERIFAGLLGGGVYASDDGGDSWRESDAGLPPGTDINSLAVAPGASTVYAGTAGAGVYVSTDNGRSWQDANGDSRALAASQIRSVLVSPSEGQVVYAATSDGYLGRSADGGGEWQLSQLPIGSTLTTMAIAGARPATLLAGTGGDGLLISTDAGTGWGVPTRNIPASESVNAVAASSATAGVIYAGTGNGIYQSVDSGTTWQRRSRDLPRGATIDSVAVDPLHGKRVLAGDDNGNIYRSQDGGTSWVALYNPNSFPVNVLLYDPASPGTVLAGTNASIYRSTDQGATWSGLGTPQLSDRGIICLAISPRAVSPTDPVAPPAAGVPGVHFFAQTGHTVRGTVYAFYHHYGDLKIFGMPLTEAFSDHGQVVQYFERARLQITADGVRESPLGSLLMARRSFPAVAPSPSSASSRYFGATHHSVSGRFLAFWASHHGPLLFGAPISQPLREQNGDGTGRSYQVQYFQDARLEYHPELAGTDNEVQLGLIGRQYLQRIGLL